MDRRSLDATDLTATSSSSATSSDGPTIASSLSDDRTRPSDDIDTANVISVDIIPGEPDIMNEASDNSLTLLEKVQQLVELVIPSGTQSAGLLPQVEELERSVLGSTQTGSISDRVDVLATTLGHMWWKCVGCVERVALLEEAIAGQADLSGNNLMKRIEALELAFPCTSQCTTWQLRLESLENQARDNGLITNPTPAPAITPTPATPAPAPSLQEPKNLWCNLGQNDCLNRASSVAIGRRYGALGCQVYWDGRNNCFLRQIQGSNTCGMEWLQKPTQGTGCKIAGSRNDVVNVDDGSTIGAPVFVVPPPTPPPTAQPRRKGVLCNGIVGDLLGGLCD